MAEMEKVMRGLECCCTHIVGMSCGNCPYEIEQRENEGISDCTSVLAYDALALLKEQEAVTIKKTKEHGFGVYGGICPKCRNWIQSAHSFCGFCGQAVKWE